MKPLAAAFAALVLAQFSFAQIMYVGTYTGGDTKGIYAYRFDKATGKLSPMGLMAETPNPTFLALDASGKFLYAINEVNEFQGKQTGGITAYAIDRNSGKLTQLNQASTGGPGPCAVAVDKTGKSVYVANYAGGSFASYPIESGGKIGPLGTFIQDNGSSVNKARQAGPHAHSVVLSPDNRFVLGGDLGLDHVMIFRTDPAAGKITPNNPPFATVRPGSGPRHLVFAPDGRHVYVASEMASTVTAFTWNPENGSLEEFQTVSALPADFKGQSTAAEIQIDARGRHVYSSNRGNDTIAVFDVDPQTAKLTLVQNESTQGKTPRFFCLDPSGHFLIVGNQDTNSIVTYRVDAKTGKLTPTGNKYELGKPVCFVFLK